MTIKECKTNPLKVGDFVKVVRGGSSDSKNLIWMVTEVNDEKYSPVVTIRLMGGTFVLYGEEYGAGYERTLHMTSLKKIEVIVKEKVSA